MPLSIKQIEQLEKEALHLLQVIKNNGKDRGNYITDILDNMKVLANYEAADLVLISIY